MMVCNTQQQLPGLHNQWQAGTYSSMMANIKPEPQTYGQYGCQYNNSNGNQQSAEEILDNMTDLKEIKLEDLCYLDNEDFGVVLDDARSLEPMRSSASPQSQYSTAQSTSSSLSDLECCGGSPGASSVESWPSDQMVPTTSPRLQSQYSDDKGLYIDTSSQKSCEQGVPQQYSQMYHPQYQQLQNR